MKKFFHSGFGKFLRWLTFLPLGLALFLLLEEIPVRWIGLAAQIEFKLTILNVIIVLIAAAVSVHLLPFFLVLYFYVPYRFFSQFIPNTKIGMIIFLPILSMWQTAAVIVCLKESAPWFVYAIKIVFLLLLYFAILKAWTEKKPTPTPETPTIL